MGCGDECPYIPGKRYLDWDLPDPKGQRVEVVRATRDDIAAARAGAGRRAGRGGYAVASTRSARNAITSAAMSSRPPRGA